MFFSTVTNCIHQFIGGYNLLVDTIFFRTGRTYLLNIGGKKVKKTPFRKIVILAKLLLCEMSSSTDNKMRSHQTLQNINHFIGGLNLFQLKRTYLLNIGEKKAISQNSNSRKITTLRNEFQLAQSIT